MGPSEEPMQVFSARVRAGAILPENGVTLPEGTRVTVIMGSSPKGSASVERPLPSPGLLERPHAGKAAQTSEVSDPQLDPGKKP